MRGWEDLQGTGKGGRKFWGLVWGWNRGEADLGRTLCPVTCPLSPSQLQDQHSEAGGRRGRPWQSCCPTEQLWVGSPGPAPPGPTSWSALWDPLAQGGPLGSEGGGRLQRAGASSEAVLAGLQQPPPEWSWAADFTPASPSAPGEAAVPWGGCGG